MRPGDPGLQTPGCFGSAGAYVLSRTGAAKLHRLKEAFFKRMVGYDDLLTALHGVRCPAAWDQAAEYFGSFLSATPYRGLKTFATVRPLVGQGSVSGEFNRVGDGKC